MSGGEIFVVTVEERLDSGNIDNFKTSTAEVLEANGAGIVIDFANTKFIDSIGLGTLVSILKSTTQKDMKVALCSLSSPVRQIFELTRLYRLFEIFETLEEAKASMK